MKANEAAKLYANTHTEWFDSEGNPNVAPAFEAGAHWAVQTMIEKACNAYCKICGHYHHTVPVRICRQECDYYSDFVKILKQL